MNNNQIEVGARIVVTDSMTRGVFTGDTGEIMGTGSGAVRVQLETGRHVALWFSEFEVIPTTSLEKSKSRLAVTQTAYDKASTALDKAKAEFKTADEAHGKAIEEFNKASRDEAANWKESDIKNFLVVDASLTNNPNLRMMVISGNDVTFFAENGYRSNTCTLDKVLATLKRFYKKTDATFTPK